MKQDLVISISPHIHDKLSTTRIMWTVSLTLLPSLLWAWYVFGARVFLVVGVAVVSALASEALCAGFFFKRFTLFDGSAFLTGLLVGYNMPPAVPLFVPAVASFFAMAVVKWTFGGLGGNFMNPALAGRVFVFFSWTGAMTNWTMPRGLDAVSGATVLGAVKTGLMDGTGGASSSLEFLARNGYGHTPLGGAVADFLTGVLKPFGIQAEGASVDLLMGSMPGCIGEVSSILLIAGGIVLLCQKIISWEIPVSYLGGFGLLVWAFGGLRFGNQLFTGDVFFHLCSGGLMLGAIYMATDMVTSPYSRLGKLIFGSGAAFLTFLIRFYGSFPEGVSLAIMLMNILVPVINRLPMRKRFGAAEVRK